jgi:hypothetical protein
MQLPLIIVIINYEISTVIQQRQMVLWPKSQITVFSLSVAAVVTKRYTVDMVKAECFPVASTITLS